MKRIICFIAAAMFSAVTVLPVFAQENSVSMDIDAAIEFALNNSPKVEKAEADIEKNKMSCKDAKKAYERKISDYEMITTFDQALVMSGYYYKASEIQYEGSKRTLEETKNTLKTDVRKAFYTAMSSKDKIDLARTNLDIVTEKYNNATAEYNAGTISKLELESFRIAVTNAQNSLKSAERTYNLNVIEVKNIINLPQDTELILTGSFNGEKLEYINSGEAKTLAKSQNAMMSIDECRQLAEDRMRIAKGWYSSNEYGFSLETATYTGTMAEMYSSEVSINFGIDTAYNAILTLEESISYLEEYIEFLKESADASYLQYQLGMTTSNDYIEVQQRYYSAQNELMDVKLSYYIAVAQYVQLYSGSSDLE